jgi:hypothetical protein
MPAAWDWGANALAHTKNALAPTCPDQVTRRRQTEASAKPHQEHLERTGLLVCRLTGNWLTGSCTRVTTQEVIIPRRLLHRVLLGRLETSAIGTPWDLHAPELQIAHSVSSSLAEFVCKFSYQFSECTTAAHRHRGRHHLCRLRSSHFPRARFSWEG